jgi:hypothetical protein
MATLGRMFQWRNALVNVKPDTLIRRQRRVFRLFWLWKSKPTGLAAMSASTSRSPGFNSKRIAISRSPE